MSKWLLLGILAAIGIREFLRLFSTPERSWSLEYVDEPVFFRSIAEGAYILEQDPYIVSLYEAPQ